MVRERKCILCEIVYSSKKEMDEHMRSMLHHRELENLQGRDCNHECRVCRVTVVGLSTYAKHISSQLHKDNVEALEKEEEKEEAEEEYFDKELVHLINKRKEQSRQEEARNSSKEQEADNYQRRREDRLPFQETGQQEWLRDPSDRNWQWQNDCFSKSRQSFLHPALNHKSSRHLNNSHGRSGWHINGPSNRHVIHVNVGGTWHSNAGGATSWHQRSTSRSFHWPQEGSGNFSNQHTRNCGVNWQSKSYNGSQWKFGNTDVYPQVRNRPSRHSDTVQENDPRWNTKNCASSSFCKDRFKWKKVDSKTSSSTPFSNSSVKPSKNTESSSSSKVNDSKKRNSSPNSMVTSSKSIDDFRSEKHKVDNVSGFKMSDNLDASSKTKSTQSSEKSNSPLREKPHRWSPYPSQKVPEVQPATPQSADKDLADQSDKTKETNSEDLKADQISGDKNVSDFPPELSDVRKTDHSESKFYRMPSLKSPLCNISDVKVLTLKRDQKNPLKGVKLSSSAAYGERQNRLSALNSETIRSNTYISKLRSASKKTNQETQDGGKKEPVETLGEVLRKAKEMLRSSQAIQSPYVQSISDTPSHDNSTTSEASKDSLQNAISLDNTLEDVSDDDFFCCEEKMATAEESNSCSISQEGVENLKTTEHTQSVTSLVPFTDTQANSPSNSESIDGENNPNSHPCQDYHDTDLLENVSDLDLQKGATHLTNAILPELSKLGLPVSLQRDLTRHMSSRSKTGSHLPEPNLNSARRIRNVSGHRKSETDKDSGLKPTLRQILSASRRNINWEQVIQHVTKKKQELGKGLPRFGIEMVAQVQSEQEGLDFDEESDLGIESYHWEAITASPLSSARKRSLSESSVIVEKASVFDIFNNHGTESCGGQSSTTPHAAQAASGQEDVKHPKGQEEEQGHLVRSSSAADMTDLSNPALSESLQSQRSSVDTCAPSGSLCTFQSASEDVVVSATLCIEANNADGTTDSCTSGTEQYDGPGVGKKRRATGDGSCPETSNLERNTKRRRLRGRKERSQVDQLLSISVREEELSNSLQGVDSNLLHARASLQAAYMEVQRLMVLKQQITMEMSAMRTQRIQILQGLQETYEPNNDGEEGSNSELQTPVMSPGNIFPFFVETPAYRSSPHTESTSPSLPSTVPVCTSPAVPAIADSSIIIKQEPLSPVIVEDNVIAPQLLPPPPPAQARSTPPPETNGEPSQTALSLYPVITATISLAELTSKFPAVAKTTVSVATSPHVCVSQKTDSDSTENHPAPVQQGQALTTNISTQETTCSTGPAENGESTLITIETKSGKKKKKLRKKKTLRAAHIPENSDTEQDIDDSKPVRKVKCRRLSKETTVSTSTSLEQEGDTASQEAELNREDNESDSNIQVMEIRNPRFEVVEIDSHSDDEKPDSPSKNDLADFVYSSQGHVETHDEVTSTSELGSHYSEENLSKAKTHRDSSDAVKISSEVSSEPGEEEQPTEGSFEGHQASVNALQIYDGTLYTCSADKSVRAYNLTTRKCEGVFEGHTSKVNCLLVTQTHGKNAVLFTGSSDHTVRCFSIKSRECIETLDLGERVLCMHVRWKILYVGLANGTVVTLSIKNNRPIDVFECHGPRAVSCLATAQEGARRLLLVGSYDCTISVRDAHNGLLLRTLEGHTKTVLCMKVVNDLVFSGSSDQSVHAHNIHTGELVRIYKGHNHAVTVVNILGKVMVTACLDKFVRVYELQSHDRLQVYGGHSDMIMCMAIHKSMIYTGCYDGSVQAVRLNLIQNYRCWWHGCSLNFGVAEHLKQHLLTDHTNPNFQTLKCRWKNCDAFFTARRGSKQDAIGHIERHAEEDSLINM